MGEFDNVLKTLDFTQLQPDVLEFKYYAPGIGQVLADEGLTEVGGEPSLSPELLGISTLSPATLPALPTATFESSAEINNPYFPLTPGTLYRYEGEEIDSETAEQQVVFVTSETTEILGITSRVVQEWEFENGVLTEAGFEYYAQDTVGNVWLLGESSIEYEYDEAGNLTGTEEDIWQAGVEQNLPGYVMVANPEAGDAYYERFQISEEADQAEVVNSDTSVSTPFGDFENVVQVQEFSDFDPDELESNYFAPGVGSVREEEIEDGEVVFSSTLMDTQEISTQLNGSEADDVLTGEDSNDFIIALDGNDTITGGIGDDVIFGGGGSDLYVFTTDAGTDTIVDFEVGIDLIGLADGLTTDDLSINQVGNNTEISLGNETLAVLSGVEASTLIDSNSFTLV